MFYTFTRRSCLMKKILLTNICLLATTMCVAMDKEDQMGGAIADGKHGSVSVLLKEKVLPRTDILFDTKISSDLFSLFAESTKLFPDFFATKHMPKVTTEDKENYNPLTWHLSIGRADRAKILLKALLLHADNRENRKAIRRIIGQRSRWKPKEEEPTEQILQHGIMHQLKQSLGWKNWATERNTLSYAVILKDCEIDGRSYKVGKTVAVNPEVLGLMLSLAKKVFSEKKLKELYKTKDSAGNTFLIPIDDVFKKTRSEIILTLYYELYEHGILPTFRFVDVLCWAIRQGDQEKVESLMRYEYAQNLKEDEDFQGKTPQKYVDALKDDGKKKIIKELLGSDPTAPDYIKSKEDY